MVILLIKQLVTVLLLLSLILVGCEKPDLSEKSVRIGLIAYTADEHSQRVGIPTLNAAQMAVDEVNKAGGVKIDSQYQQVELIVEGIASSPQNAVAATRKLTNRENVVAIVGLQYSVDAIPAGAFAEKAHVPLISPMSTNRLTTEGRNYVFRMSFVDELQGAVMARCAFQDFGSRRAAVLFSRSDPYSSGIAEVFSSVYNDMGGAIVAYESFTDKTTDFMAHIEAIKAAKPDVLYLPNFSTVVLEQVRQLRQMGLKVRLLGADGWNAREFSMNSDFNGSYMTTHWSRGMEAVGADEFVKSYMYQFNSEPGAVAALTYDSMQVLFKALENTSRLNGESIRLALMEMEPFEGVTGSIDFIDSGDPVKGVVVLRLQDKQVSFQKIISWEGGR